MAFAMDNILIGSLTLLGWMALAIGMLLIGSALLCLLVACLTQDRIERGKNFRFSGKLLLLGLVIFIVGFGSCALVFQLWR